MVGNYSGSLILYTEFIDFILFLIDIKFILSRGNALSKRWLFKNIHSRFINLVSVACYFWDANFLVF